MNQYTYLALGDSYTIGEQVPIYENFPYQLVQLLRKKNIGITAPEIIAKTGWTTDELIEGIRQTNLLATYDIVTLLIGVNNQYRGRSVDDYKNEFEMLLQKAIVFAGNNHERVFVVSIPDWGVTPFADGRDREKVAFEIDAYNAACKMITESHHCSFTDITIAQRKDGMLDDFLAPDKLHPSGNEYAKWAAALAAIIKL